MGSYEKYFIKWRGKASCQTPYPTAHTLFWSFVTSFIAILIISFLSLGAEVFPLMAPFGASAVLMFGVPSAPFAQPRNLIGGHLTGALIGVLIFRLLGPSVIGVALAVSFSIVIMLILRAVHPPAGATALLGASISNGSFFWIINPILISVLILLVLALIVNNFDEERSYPEYWL